MPQRTICAFEGQSEEELTFDEGVELIVLQQLDGGWWEGKYNGRVGWFPRDYVVLVPRETRVKSASVGDSAGGVLAASGAGPVGTGAGPTAGEGETDAAGEVTLLVKPVVYVSSIYPAFSCNHISLAFVVCCFVF